MQYNYKTELAGSEIVTLADAKAQLNISGTLDDTILNILIPESRAYVEQFCHVNLVAKTVTQSSEPEDRIKLLFEATDPITEIKYLDTDDAEQTIDVSNFNFNDVTNVLVKKSTYDWPSGMTDLRVKYTSPAYANSSEYKKSVLMVLTLFYENREGFPAQDLNRVNRYLRIKRRWGWQ